MMAFAVVRTVLVSLLLSNFSYAWISPSDTNLIKHPFGIVLGPESLVCNARREVKISPRFIYMNRRDKTQLHSVWGTIWEFFTGKKDPPIPINYNGTVGKTPIPIFRLHIDESYRLAPDSSRLDQLIKWTEEEQLTDLWVVSHGWLTSADDAFRTNYEPLFAEFGALAQKQPPLKEKKFGVVGITWNSLSRKAAENWNKIFESEMQAMQRTKGVAMLSDVSNVDIGTSNEDLKQELRNMFGITEDIEAIQRLFDEDSSLPFDDKDDDDAPRSRNIVQQALALPTFRIMKGRAAQSGLKSLSPTLGSLRESNPSLQIHLVGHSFGALLVSATANNGNSGDYSSLTLLQGAFSKNSFAPTAVYKTLPGMFKDVIIDNKVNGTITVTHTKKDNILELGYLLAAETYNGKPFIGVEIPNFQPLAVGDRTLFDLQAIGDNGVASTEQITFKWDNLKDFDPSSQKGKKIHSISASDAVNGHNDVWDLDITQLLVKVAQVNSK